MGDISVRDIYADKVLVANTINQVELKRYLDRAVEGSASRQDLEAIDRELITVGIRDASISIVADTIQTVRNVTEIYSAADAPSVLALLDQREKFADGLVLLEAFEGGGAARRHAGAHLGIIGAARALDRGNLRAARLL